MGRGFESHLSRQRILSPMSIDRRGFSVPFLVNISGRIFGDMAELVDAPDLGSGPARGDGFESLYPHHTLVEPSSSFRLSTTN